MVDTNKEISGQSSIDASHSDENVGKIVEVTVSMVVEYGVFVNWGKKGRKSGLIYWKELSDSSKECYRLLNTLKQGDKLTAMIITSHLAGKLSLSVKALTRKRKEEERKRKEEFPQV